MISIATKGMFGNSIETNGKFLSAGLLGDVIREVFRFLSKITTTTENMSSIAGTIGFSTTITLAETGDSKYELEKR